MAKNSAFGKAFSAARKAGKSTFSFGGKSYTTKTKEEGNAPVPKKRSMKGKVTAPSAAVAKANANTKKLSGPVPKKKAKSPSLKGSIKWRGKD